MVAVHDWPEPSRKAPRAGAADSTTAPLPPRRPNRLGLAGFIVSLVGLLTLGCLSPVGLVLSLIAVFRRPRGCAVAGLVLGCIGVTVGGIIGTKFVFSWLELAPAISDGGVIAEELAKYRQSHAGSFPPSLDDLPGLPVTAKVDEWKQLYHYRVCPEGWVELTSDGEDGIPGTADDFRVRIDGSRVLAYRGSAPRFFGR